MVPRCKYIAYSVALTGSQPRDPTVDHSITDRRQRIEQIVPYLNSTSTSTPNSHHGPMCFRQVLPYACAFSR